MPKVALEVTLDVVTDVALELCVWLLDVAGLLGAMRRMYAPAAAAMSTTTTAAARAVVIARLE